MSETDEHLEAAREQLKQQLENIRRHFADLETTGFPKASTPFNEIAMMDAAEKLARIILARNPDDTDGVDAVREITDFRDRA